MGETNKAIGRPVVVDHSAILAAASALPRRQYKVIAHDFKVSERYVQQLAAAAGIRRKPRKAVAASDHHQAEGANG